MTRVGIPGSNQRARWTGKICRLDDLLHIYCDQTDVHQPASLNGKGSALIVRKYAVICLVFLYILKGCEINQSHLIKAFLYGPQPKPAEATLHYPQPFKKEQGIILSQGLTCGQDFSLSEHTSQSKSQRAVRINCNSNQWRKNNFNLWSLCFLLMRLRRRDHRVNTFPLPLMMPGTLCPFCTQIIVFMSCCLLFLHGGIRRLIRFSCSGPSWKPVSLTGCQKELEFVP